MEIQRLITHLIVLFKFDEIEIVKLLNQSNASALGKLLNFNEFQADDKLMLQHGIFKDQNQDCAITRLVIEERRLLLDLEGSSKDGEKIFHFIKQFLVDLAGKDDPMYLMPVVMTQESEIVARMNIDIYSFFSKKFVESMNILGDTIGELNAETKINPASITYISQFIPKNSLLDDYRISLTRKEIIFGLRPGSPISEKMFYSRMPLDTDTHIHFLTQLETNLG